MRLVDPPILTKLTQRVENYKNLANNLRKNYFKELNVYRQMVGSHSDRAANVEPSAH